MNDDKYALGRFRAAVRILDTQRRILIESRAEADIVDALSAIVRHLNGLSDTAVQKIIAGPRQKDMARARKEQEAAAASEMSLDRVSEALSNAETTRAQLEAIAVGRFQVPRGSLRSLGSMEQLREKISTLVENERTHQNISSVAKDTRY